MLAALVEKTMAEVGTGDTFLGRKTQEPFPPPEEPEYRPFRPLLKR